MDSVLQNLESRHAVLGNGHNLSDNGLWYLCTLDGSNYYLKHFRPAFPPNQGPQEGCKKGNKNDTSWCSQET